MCPSSLFRCIVSVEPHGAVSYVEVTLIQSNSYGVWNPLPVLSMRRPKAGRSNRLFCLVCPKTLAT